MNRVLTRTAILLALLVGIGLAIANRDALLAATDRFSDHRTAPSAAASAALKPAGSELRTDGPGFRRGYRRMKP